jgi:hypothetical protein
VGPRFRRICLRYEAVVCLLALAGRRLWVGAEGVQGAAHAKAAAVEHVGLDHGPADVPMAEKLSGWCGGGDVA